MFALALLAIGVYVLATRGGGFDKGVPIPVSGFPLGSLSSQATGTPFTTDVNQGGISWRVTTFPAVKGPPSPLSFTIAVFDEGNWVSFFADSATGKRTLFAVKAQGEPEDGVSEAQAKKRILDTWGL